MGGTQVPGTGGRIFRLVTPFVVAIATGVIVWASQRGAAPPSDGPRIDPGQQQLVNAVIAGFAALMITVIVVRVVTRPKPRRSRRT